MNWAFKIVAKLFLSRVPLSYTSFRRVGVFRHGHMNKSTYAIGVFFKHMKYVGGADVFRGKTCLELGPGDSLASAILAHAVGAKKTYLVDVGPFAENSSSIYGQVVQEIEERGYSLSDLKGISGTNDLLKRTGAVYLTNGLRSLRNIPSESVDIIWSQAVLEHIRIHEVPDVLRELRRILRPTGIMSHRIDYKDHLGGGLNNLRFPSKIWEAELMASSGFYTNRVRNSEYLRLIEDAGFHVISAKPGKWDAVPIRRKNLAVEFQTLSDEDLITRNVDVVATAKAQ